MLNSSCASTGPLLRTCYSGHPLGPARLAVVSPSADVEREVCYGLALPMVG